MGREGHRWPTRRPLSRLLSNNRTHPQGHHPFAFALAELIDNALRATKAVAAGAPRAITVSLVLPGDLAAAAGGPPGATGAGLICVRDNGAGMSKGELNQWAVMNLSMEDRGLAPGSPAMGGGGGSGSGSGSGGSGGRYLSGDISYFGVGSKNAAFFLGRSVKARFCAAMRGGGRSSGRRLRRRVFTAALPLPPALNPG